MPGVNRLAFPGKEMRYLLWNSALALSHLLRGTRSLILNQCAPKSSIYFCAPNEERF